VATYKLIQDIEAEDHILGPLTLRQFIFALIAAFLLYICFIAVARHVPFLLVFLLPPALFCAFFAFPWGRDQPTETWALAKIRFLFGPRKRVWNQSGVKELVTITAPKKVEKVLTDNLSQTEVKSRLQALANTIDSRGWAIKHINAVGYVPQNSGSDRLIDIPEVPAENPGDSPSDIMDPDQNPLAQQFQAMMNKSSQDYRQRLVAQLQAPTPAAATASPAGSAAAGQTTAPAAQQWFINHNPVPDGPMAAPAPAVPAAPAAAASAAPPAVDTAPEPDTVGDNPVLSSSLKERSRSSGEYSHLRTLRPAGSARDDGTRSGRRANGSPSAGQGRRNKPSTAVTVSSDPAILSLSKNNDLNVSTLAREAQRAKRSGTQDEVVISLH
jgi:hypothetical protein